MQEKEGYFKGTNNFDLYWKSWLPEGQPKAIIMLAHGLGEHISRYKNVIDNLVPLGFAVYGMDHEGHGKSGGKRLYVNKFQVYIDDFKTYFDTVAKNNPGMKIFLLGHSMGGLIATIYTIQHQKDLTGLIVSAPLLKPGESITPATIQMARILSALIPKMGVQALDSTYLSCNKGVVEAYDKDPLVCRGKITARLGSELFVAMADAEKGMKTITLPLLIMQGSDDKLVSHEGARVLYEKASSADKNIKIYDGFYHEIFNEDDRAKVFADLDAWLDKHI
jgi:acylglycerol lipase